MSDKALLAHQNLLTLLRNSRKNFIFQGKILYLLRVNGAYKNSFGADTWDDYLKSPEIGMSRREADLLIKIYETFVLKFGYSEEYLSEIPRTAINLILPFISKYPKEKIEEMLLAAQTLSIKDFKERFYDIRSDNKGERTYEYIIMKRCIETGTMEKIHDIESDKIKEFFNL